MISAEQIRGARAMLDLTRKDLAAACGVSHNTLYSLEKGLSVRSSTKVRTALEKKGVEFLGTTGVTLRSDGSAIYDGPDSCDRFYQDMLAAAQEKGGDLWAICPTSEILAQSFGVGSTARPERLEKLSKFVSIKCLLLDAPHSSLSLSSVQFRATNAPNPTGPWLVFVCGDRHVMMRKKSNGNYFFSITRDIMVARQEIDRVTSLWDNALPVAPSRT